MIIVKLIGGLGNQMFQYAAGKRLALKYRTELKLDLSHYDKVDPEYRKYDLSRFNIKENFASTEELEQIKKNGWKKLLEKIKPYYKRSSIKYSGYDFDPHILELSDNVHLDGYWQSERYFIDIANTIRHEFTLKKEMDARAREFSEKIQNTNSISLHIRRGDYLTSKFSSIYPVLNIDYYHQALNFIKDKIKDPQIFIFTDDIEWVKNNLDIQDQIEFVSGQKEINVNEEMILMSQCRHNIIANSSFSWWGAWLNTNQDKIVIAPQNWLNVDNYHINDLVPEKWIKI